VVVSIQRGMVMHVGNAARNIGLGAIYWGDVLIRMTTVSKITVGVA
jgi:hypothetical protein